MLSIDSHFETSERASRTLAAELKSSILRFMTFAGRSEHGSNSDYQARFQNIPGKSSRSKRRRAVENRFLDIISRHSGQVGEGEKKREWREGGFAKGDGPLFPEIRTVPLLRARRRGDEVVGKEIALGRIDAFSIL